MGGQEVRVLVAVLQTSRTIVRSRLFVRRVPRLAMIHQRGMEKMA
jgi:hypothetical protein